MLAQWSKLKSAMVAWRQRLGQSQSMQHFKREADEAAAWMAEKMQIACDESYKDPTNLSVRRNRRRATNPHCWVRQLRRLTDQCFLQSHLHKVENGAWSMGVAISIMGMQYPTDTTPSVS